MPINNPDAPAMATRPRLRVLVNGHSPGTAVAAHVSDTGHFHAARFDAEFALLEQGVGSAGWWAAQKPPVAIDVQWGLLPDGAPEGAVAGWVSLIQGLIDHRTLDLRANTMRIEGRDYTARLIDAKTQAAYANQTASEVVTTLAAAVGLQAAVTKTTTLVGRYYELEHDHISLDQFHRVTTYWDLIVTLARFEGFDAWVDGTTLHFAPPPAANADPYVVRWTLGRGGIPTGNAIDLKLERSDTIAKGVQVTVKSWHAKQGRGFVAGYPSQKPVNSIGASKVQQYVVVRPNLTQDQAVKLAQAIYTEIVRHERIISTPLTPDLILTPRVLIRLTGTGTDFDQTYYPLDVTRRLTSETCEMTLRAKNQSPVAAEAGAQLGASAGF